MSSADPLVVYIDEDEDSEIINSPKVSTDAPLDLSKPPPVDFPEKPKIKLFQPYSSICTVSTPMKSVYTNPLLLQNATTGSTLMQRPILRTRGRERSLLPCEVCGKAFDRPSLLKRHLRTHTGEKPHVCDVCSKGFSTSSSLNTHRRIHSGEKPHQCPICGKRFTASSNLYYHRMTHNKEKPHKCLLCGKSFPTPGDLKSHQYVHSGSWPYNCPICHRGFSKQTNLRNHLLLHSGDKPHNCQICGKKFALACNLRAHLRTHEEDPMSTCEACKRTFLTTSHMVNNNNGLCKSCEPKSPSENSEKTESPSTISPIFPLYTEKPDPTRIFPKKPGSTSMSPIFPIYTPTAPPIIPGFSSSVFEWYYRLAKESGMIQQQKQFLQSHIFAAQLMNQQSSSGAANFSSALDALRMLQQQKQNPADFSSTISNIAASGSKFGDSN